MKGKKSKAYGNQYKRTCLLLAGGALLLLISGPDAVLAQTEGQAAVSSERVISEEQIRSFAGAQVEIGELMERYIDKAEKGEFAGKDALEEELSREMAEVVKRNGLSLVEYHRIAGAVIADEKTYERVVRHLEKMQAGADG